MIKILTPLVSVNWLNQNLTAENMVILDATIPKVTGGDVEKEKKQIPNTIFFDLKNVFLNKEGNYPNTIPSEAHFQEEVQKIGINQNSTIVVYDDIGLYSSARVWWLFKTFGFENVAVLNGGLPAWKKEDYLVEAPIKNEIKRGDFEAKFDPSKYIHFHEVHINLTSNKFCLADARSNDRFHAKVKEPREEVRGGHIPNSISLPYSELQKDGFMKTKEELKEIFTKINPNNKNYIFSCGTGITACILALGLEITENKNYAVYDGSWTEWGSIINLPVEK